VGACPTSQIQFNRSLPKPQHQSYDPGRREFLATSMLSLTGLAAASAEGMAHYRTISPLRPPGVESDIFSARCLRCGICVRACPTGAIQSGVTDIIWSDLFTPVLSLRDGYCLYSCNACGQACPVEAIPPLTLPEKQSIVIGHAFIDHNRCIPWSEGGSCIVCEEMCPLPEKAITLDVREEIAVDGTKKTLRLPVVNQEICIGCGICEYKCPRVGAAAIHVYPLDNI
jgi:NAD-dependent dihydropyrimidine dehydrogenase PreA subunit